MTKPFTGLISVSSFLKEILIHNFGHTLDLQIQKNLSLSFRFEDFFYRVKNSNINLTVQIH